VSKFIIEEGVKTNGRAERGAQGRPRALWVKREQTENSIGNGAIGGPKKTGQEPDVNASCMRVKEKKRTSAPCGRREGRGGTRVDVKVPRGRAARGSAETDRDISRGNSLGGEVKSVKIWRPSLPQSGKESESEERPASH